MSVFSFILVSIRYLAVYTTIQCVRIVYFIHSLQNKLYNTSYYPVYHTLHDTVYWIEHFVDREYKVHLTSGKVGMMYLLTLADAPILPFTMTRYHEAIDRGVKAISGEMKGVAGIEDSKLSLSLTLYCMGPKNSHIYINKTLTLKHLYFFPRKLCDTFVTVCSKGLKLFIFLFPLIRGIRVSKTSTMEFKQ